MNQFRVFSIFALVCGTAVVCSSTRDVCRLSAAAQIPSAAFKDLFFLIMFICLFKKLQHVLICAVTVCFCASEQLESARIVSFFPREFFLSNAMNLPSPKPDTRAKQTRCTVAGEVECRRLMMMMMMNRTTGLVVVVGGAPPE